MTFPNGGNRDELHANRSVIRDRFNAGQTLSLEEYKALNPTGESLTEPPPSLYHTSYPASGHDTGANIVHERSTITPGHPGVNGRVRGSGPST